MTTSSLETTCNPDAKIQANDCIAAQLLNNMTILLVDDDPVITILAKKILQRSNFKVETAGDGLTALEIIDQVKPDLVLLDFNMPRLDGFETCRRLRADKKYDHIPIIFLTATTDPDQKVLP